MSLFEYINYHKDYLTKFLHTTIDHKIQDAQKEQFLADSYQRIKSFAVSGKMIRGVMTILSYEMNKGILTDKVYSAAAGIELTHSSFLVHDDIVDNDYIRRGNRTIFAQYEDDATKDTLTNPHFYGQSMGILNGDISLLFAYEMMVLSSEQPEVLQKLLSFYIREVQRVNGAQMIDIHYGASSYEPTSDEILFMNTCKSARYTFSLPFVTGAILANASQTTINSLDALGEKLGIVFQIKDDEIELYSTEEEIGKPVGSDIRENKKTYLRSLLYSKANNTEKAKLNTIFGNPDIQANDIEYVKELLDKHGVNSEISGFIGKLTHEAQELLTHLSGDTEKKKILEELIEYNYSRTS